MEEHVHVRRVVEDSLANQVRARPFTRLVRDVHLALREEPWRERVLLTGMPDILVDGDVIALTMVPLGRYQYHDTEGHLRTVRRYGPVEAGGSGSPL